MTTALALPRLHVAIMGESGSGKSTILADFPKPTLVLQADPVGNEQAYLDRGIPLPEERGPENQPIIPVQSRRNDRRIIQVEQYHDDVPEKPWAFNALLTRSARIPQEIADGKWATVGLDGYTFFEYLARKRRQYDPGFIPSDGKTHVWSTADVEEFVFGRMAGWRCNVVLLCHIDEDKDELHGTFIRNPKAPGKMRKGTAGAFQEMYRAYVAGTGDDGEPIYKLQTRPNAAFNCKSRIKAPNDIQWFEQGGIYRALFRNWIAKQEALRAADSNATTVADASAEPNAAAPAS